MTATAAARMRAEERPGFDPPIKVPVRERELSKAVIAAAAAVEPAELLRLLNDLRDEKGLSYERLGRRAGQKSGMSRSSAQALLTGRTLPSQRQLHSFLRACGVSTKERELWHVEVERIRTKRAPQRVKPPPVLRPPTRHPRVDRPTPPPPAAGVPRPDARAGVLELPATAADPRSEPPQKPWPTLTRTPRGPKRRVVTWHGLRWFTVSALASTLGAIALTRLGADVEVIMALQAIAAGCVANWFRKRRPRPRERRHYYPYHDDSSYEIFVNDELVAPPVIGM